MLDTGQLELFPLADLLFVEANDLLEFLRAMVPTWVFGLHLGKYN
jgi:hypothetical protein